MAQPQPYNRQFNFADQQALTPSTPLPGTQVDAELNQVKLTLDQTLANLKKLQRDDGALRNGIVTQDSLSPSLSIGFTLRGPWEAGVNYIVGDGVTLDTSFYRARASNLSTNLNRPDVDPATWEEVADFSVISADAAASAAAAAASATAAATSEANASGFAVAAAVSEANAAASAAAAAASATGADTSEANAASSAAAAAASATAADGSADAAAVSATDAANSAAEAEASVTGTVRYDTVQSLTSPQKTQATANIAAVAVGAAIDSLVVTTKLSAPYLETTESTARNFRLRARTLASLSFPVPTFQPIASNAPIALDLHPSGPTPVESAGNGFTWFDACTADVMHDNVNPIQCARVAARSVGAVFAAVPYNGAAANHLYLETNNTLRWICGATNGVFGPVTDNAYSLGSNGFRVSSVWAANGTIQTSDEEQKVRVATAVPGLAFVRDVASEAAMLFRWKVGGNEVEVVEETVEEDVPDTIEVEEVEEAFSVVDGKAVQCRRVVKRYEQLVDMVPLFDEVGAPVMEEGEDGEARQKLHAVPRTKKVSRVVRNGVPVARPGKRIHAGFGAQSVKRVMDRHGVDFGAYIDAEDGTKGLRADQMIPPLYAAIDQLAAIVEKQAELIDSLRELRIGSDAAIAIRKLD